MEINNGDRWWLIYQIQVRGYGFIRVVYVMLIMCVGVGIVDMKGYGFKVNLFNVNMGYRREHMGLLLRSCDVNTGYR